MYSDQYPEMSGILSRYQTLKKFNQNLLKRSILHGNREIELEERVNNFREGYESKYYTAQ
jgi:hypothetical protein